MRHGSEVMSSALMSIADLMGPVAEAVDGYRTDLERRGYSPTAAETMAIDYHRMLLSHLTWITAGDE